MGFYNIIIYTGAESGALVYLVYGLLLLCLAAGDSVIGLALVLFKFIIYGNSWPDSRGGNTKLSSYSSYL